MHILHITHACTHVQCTVTCKLIVSDKLAKAICNYSTYIIINNLKCVTITMNCWEDIVVYIWGIKVNYTSCHLVTYTSWQYYQSVQTVIMSPPPLMRFSSTLNYNLAHDTQNTGPLRSNRLLQQPLSGDSLGIQTRLLQFFFLNQSNKQTNKQIKW